MVRLVYRVKGNPTFKKVKTNKKGRFKTRIPTWWADKQKIQARVPADGEFRAAKSPVRKLNVKPRYKPSGPKSDHEFMIPGARWNPCKPIRYKVNLAHARPGAMKDLKKALKMISEGSGYRFKNAGRQQFMPYKANQKGAAPAGILSIGWTNQKESPEVTGLGRGGFGYVGGRRDGTKWITYGRLAIDATKLFDAYRYNRKHHVNLLVHEVMHVLNVQHRKNSKMMQPVLSRDPNIQLDAGDRQALRKLGMASGCVK